MRWEGGREWFCVGVYLAGSMCLCLSPVYSELEFNTPCRYSSTLHNEAVGLLVSKSLHSWVIDLNWRIHVLYRMMYIPPLYTNLMCSSCSQPVCVHTSLLLTSHGNMPHTHSCACNLTSWQWDIKVLLPFAAHLSSLGQIYKKKLEISVTVYTYSYQRSYI